MFSYRNTYFPFCVSCLHLMNKCMRRAITLNKTNVSAMSGLWRVNLEAFGIDRYYRYSAVYKLYSQNVNLIFFSYVDD